MATSLKFSRKQLLNMGLILVVLVVLAVMVVFLNNYNQAVTVKLSNGKLVSLGDSQAKLAKSLGSGIKAVTSTAYRYPADTKKPTEAVIYIDKSKVTGILILRNARNNQQLTGATIGMPLKTLKKKLVGVSSLKPIDTSKDTVKQVGYKANVANAVSYYVTFSCSKSSNEKVTIMGLTSKGHEKSLLPLSKKVSCTSKTAVPKTQTTTPATKTN